MTLSDYISDCINCMDWDSTCHASNICSKCKNTKKIFERAIIGSKYIDENNSSGFDGLPGGIRDSLGLFNYLDWHGYWWTSSSISEKYALCRVLSVNDRYLKEDAFSKSCGLSVRCIKD